MSLLRSSGASVLACSALAAVVALMGGGCGSTSTQPPGDDGGVGSSNGGSGGSSGVSHAALPQVDDNGGGIVTAPEIVTITFEPSLYANAISPDATTMIADLLDFDDTLTQSTYWDTVRAGYCEPLNSRNCVGKGTTVDPTTDHVSIATAPDATYTDAPDYGPSTLRPYISALFAANTLPPPNGNRVYVFYFPKSTTITVSGGVTCSDIGGYHNDLLVGAVDVPYAIVPVCDPEMTEQATPELTVEQMATFSASHEIIESVTDPHESEPPTGSNSAANLGFYMTNAASQAWPIVLGGGEVADLCLDILGLGEDRSTAGKYTTQRVWNNLSAAANHDPCVPIPSGEVYFNVAPPVADQEFQIAVGGTNSFNAVAFSDGTMDAWTVQLVDVGQNATNTQSTVLTTAPTKASTNNGDSVACSITLNSTPPDQPDQVSGPGVEPYALVSVNAAGEYHLWPGLVAAQ